MGIQTTSVASSTYLPSQSALHYESETSMALVCEIVVAACPRLGGRVNPTSARARPGSGSAPGAPGMTRTTSMTARCHRRAVACRVSEVGSTVARHIQRPLWSSEVLHFVRPSSPADALARSPADSSRDRGWRWQVAGHPTANKIKYIRPRKAKMTPSPRPQQRTPSAQLSGRLTRRLRPARRPRTATVAARRRMRALLPRPPARARGPK